MKPWERRSGTGKPWESSQPASGGNNLSVTMPVAPGIIPYTDPSQIAQQNENVDQAEAARQFQEWRLDQLRKQYGPVGTAAISGTNEVTQPVLGAANLLGKAAGADDFAQGVMDISNRNQHATDLMTQARPMASYVGQALPYMATGPAAQRGYFNMINKMRPGFIQRTLANPLMSSVIPGSIEGGTIAGLNPQQSGVMGAGLGAGGNYVGQRIAKTISKAPVNLSPYDEGMLKIADDWNIRMLPGAKSGNIGLMQADDALMKNPKSAGALAHYRAEQEQTITKKVLGVAGMDTTNVKPGDIYLHKNALGKQYDALEKNSKPIFSNKSLDDIVDTRAAYNDLSPNDNNKWINQLEDEFMKISSLNPNGEIPIYAYQGFKNRLNKMINGYSGKALDGEQSARKSVAENYLAILRDTMKKGSNDPEVLKKWADLDSKYAATNFIEKHNIINDDGVVDYKRLYRAMNTDNPGQLAAMNGPWEDMAKAAHLGRYITANQNPTLGAHHEINKLMGARQGKGISGRLASFGAGSKFMPDAMVNWYAWSNPKRGAWRLPETSPLWAGNVTSAAARGGPLMIDTEQR